jgi:uncharacterized SAM-binding protein YcdF (DUF218 family)
VIRRAVSAVLLLYMLGYALFAVMLPRPADERRTDAIVVLTGGAKRIERGLAADGKEAGSADAGLRSRPDRPPRGACGAISRRRGPVRCCVDLGRESVDTRSNAEEVARWMERHKFRTMRLVTTDWHMPRARFELSRRLGGDIEVVGDAVESNPSFGQLFTEYNKYLLRRCAVLVGI